MFALRYGTCVGSCRDGEYESGKRCLLCHEECDGCTGGSQQDCIACKNVKNFLGDGGRFECLASGSYPTNTFENMINSTCDECHPNCAECIGTSFENCTRCKNPPGYTIIPSEDDDPGVFGCCDTNSVAFEKNKTCIQTYSLSVTPTSPVTSTSSLRTGKPSSHIQVPMSSIGLVASVTLTSSMALHSSSQAE